MNSRGFTLIEIIIALAIFTVLAMITSSALVQSVHLQERVSAHSEHTTHLELTLALLQQDIAHFIPRAVRGNEMHLFPPIIGQHRYFEFTRGGIDNPMNIEQRSTLARIAYLCDQDQLIRRIWQQLDTTDRQQYHDTVLIKKLKKCTFEYMGLHNIWVSTWYQEPLQDKKSVRVFLPKAVQVNLTLNQDEPLKVLFAIPGGVE